MSLQIETQPFQFNSSVTGLSSATFNSVSAASLSGTFYGDGSKLTGVVSVSGTPNQINASKSGSTVTLSLPNSAIFPGDVSIIGNLSISGSATYINTKNLIVGDNIIYFNDNNYGSNVLDMGIVSHFSQAPLGYNHTGLIRRAGQGVPGTWTLFSGLTTEPASATNIDWNDKNIRIDSLSANLIGNVTGNADTVTNGVYTNQSYSDPSWITSLADTKITGTTFATNTTLQSTSALLTTLTLTNTLTSQLVLNTTFNNYQTNVASSTATLLPTSIYQNTSGSFVPYTAINSVTGNWNTAYQALSTNPYILNQSLSSTTTIIGSNTANNTFSEVLGGQCNLASGTYSTIVNGFSSCATGYATFVGAGSGNRATGDYAAAVGGRCNTASGCYSTVGGGVSNTASGSKSFVGGGGASGAGNTASAQYSIIVGGKQNCISGVNSHGIIVGGCSNILCTVGSANYPAIVGGQSNKHTYSGYSFIGGGCNNCTCSQFGQSQNINYATVVGGNANAVTNNYSIIGGGLGNYNPLRDSQIVGGVANHTGGYAPSNFVTGTSLSGNGSCTCICGTNIQNCFSYPFTSGNISVYYATAANPLSAGTFSTATIAATGTNYVILNTDYSACSNGLSATSLYVYDRAINNTGYDNFIGGGKLNTASGCYGVIGGGVCNVSTGAYGTIAGGCFNKATGCLSFIGSGRNNCTSSSRSVIVGGDNNTSSNGYTFIGNGYNNCASGNGAVVVGGNGSNVSSGGSSFVGAGSSNIASGGQSVIVGGITNSTSGCVSTIVGGRYNYNPLYNSDIHGGSFNHTGGYAPLNIVTSTSLSGNGSCSCICGSNIQNCFASVASNSIFAYYATATNPLSSGTYTTATITASGTNYVIFNKDFSACVNGLSATNLYLYDSTVNNTGCFNFIGGGVLNTVSGCYGVLGGGKCNLASGIMAIVGGGCCNIASGGQSTVSGGYKNTASGGYNTVGGGSTNTAGTGNGNTVAGGRGNVASGGYGLIGSGYGNNNAGGYSAIAGGCTNCACGTVYPNPAFQFIGAGACNKVSNGFTSIVGGFCNTASGNYSFVAGGSANDTKGFTNTFILGTALSATQANTTYVNNLSVQGNIASNTSYVVTAALTANQTMGSGTDTVLTLDPKNDPNSWFSRTAGTGLTARRITPTIPGYYNINYQVSWQPSVSAVGAQNNIQIMKVSGGTGSANTISIVQQPIINTSINTTQNTSAVTYMNGTTDYLYFQGYSSNSAQVVTGESNGVWTKVEVFKIN